ncbi:unnamed protein product [Effrenium voratum]|nr:unnamed protein product [Effrenium voratum]
MEHSGGDPGFSGEGLMSRVQEANVRAFRQKHGLMQDSDFGFAFEAFEDAVRVGGHAAEWARARAEQQAHLLPAAAAVVEVDPWQVTPVGPSTLRRPAVRLPTSNVGLRLRQNPDNAEAVGRRVNLLTEAFMKLDERVTQSEATTILNAVRTFQELSLFLAARDVQDPEELDFHAFLEQAMSPSRALQSLRWLSNNGRLQWQLDRLKPPKVIGKVRKAWPIREVQRVTQHLYHGVVVADCEAWETEEIAEAPQTTALKRRPAPSVKAMPSRLGEIFLTGHLKNGTALCPDFNTGEQSGGCGLQGRHQRHRLRSAEESCPRHCQSPRPHVIQTAPGNFLEIPECLGLNPADSKWDRLVTVRGKSAQIPSLIYNNVKGGALFLAGIPTPEDWDRIWPLVRRSLYHGDVIIVHCMAERHRAALAAAMWLAMLKGISLADAAGEIRRCRDVEITKTLQDRKLAGWVHQALASSSAGVPEPVCTGFMTAKSQGHVSYPLCQHKQAVCRADRLAYPLTTSDKFEASVWEQLGKNFQLAAEAEVEPWLGKIQLGAEAQIQAARLRRAWHAVSLYYKTAEQDRSRVAIEDLDSLLGDTKLRSAKEAFRVRYKLRFPTEVYPSDAAVSRASRQMSKRLLCVTSVWKVKTLQWQLGTSSKKRKLGEGLWTEEPDDEQPGHQDWETYLDRLFTLLLAYALGGVKALDKAPSAKEEDVLGADTTKFVFVPLTGRGHALPRESPVIKATYEARDAHWVPAGNFSAPTKERQQACAAILRGDRVCGVQNHGAKVPNRCVLKYTQKVCPGLQLQAIADDGRGALRENPDGVRPLVRVWPKATLAGYRSQSYAQLGNARLPTVVRVADVLADGKLPPDVVYVGQGHHSHRVPRSQWASPFVQGHTCTTDDWLPLYVDFVLANLQAELPALQGKRLACDCGPDGVCEADALAGMVFDATHPDAEASLPRVTWLQWHSAQEWRHRETPWLRAAPPSVEPWQQRMGQASHWWMPHDATE